ncbi:hypothetical protein ACFL09_01310 [Planctomycetota bacterium]
MVSMPARATEERSFEAGPGLLHACALDALSALGWPTTTVGERVIQAKVSLNWLSWGEELRIELDDGGVVRATSRCAFPLQVADWGKNRKNVVRLFDHLELQLATRKSGE